MPQPYAARPRAAPGRISVANGGARLVVEVHRTVTASSAARQWNTSRRGSRS
jgi:hypothetical protein